MSAPKRRAGSHASTSASGQQILAALARLPRGLRQWVLANMPTGGGLTVPRATLLRGLSLKSEPAGMSELGEALGMSPRNMTVLVDGLEREGLVRRVSHAQDRRVTLVALTATGRRLADRELGASQSAAATLFDDFTAVERRDFLRLLEKMADALRARGIDVPVADQRREDESRDSRKPQRRRSGSA